MERVCSGTAFGKQNLVNRTGMNQKAVKAMPMLTWSVLVLMHKRNQLMLCLCRLLIDLLMADLFNALLIKSFYI